MQTDISASLLYTLWEQPLGRRTLVERTGITESTVRTHLNKLRDRGWVAFAKAGTTLTPEAKSMFSKLFQSVQNISEVQLDDLGVMPEQIAVHLRIKKQPEATWQLRDRAIQSGAGGALLLRFDQQLVFPDEVNPLDNDFPESDQTLLKTFPDLKNGDWVLVAFSHQKALAQRGLWSMVVEFLKLEF